MDTPIEGGESSSFRNSEEKCLQRVIGPGIFPAFPHTTVAAHVLARSAL